MTRIGMQGPPSYSPTQQMVANYQTEEPDFTKSVNESIDQTQKWNDDHARQLIQIYNHLHERSTSKPKELLALLKQGNQTKDDWDKFSKYWDSYYKFAHRLRGQQDEFENILGGDQWATYQGKGNFDPDIQKELDSQEERTLVKAEAMQLGSEIRGEFPYEGNELIRGPGGAYERETEIFQDLDQLLVHYEHTYRPQAEAGMKIHIPGQYTADGKPIYKTYQEARGPEERQYLSDMIDAWYAHSHQGLTGGRVGLYKQKFVTKLIELDKVRVKNALEDDGKALQEIQLDNRAKELKVQIQQDPSFLVTYLQTYKGFNNNSFALARKEAFDILERGIATGELQRAEIEAVLDHRFHAHDSTVDKPHIVSAREYWKKDSRRLLKALAKAEKEEATEDSDMREAEMLSRAKEIVAQFDDADSPITFQAVNDIQLNFMKEFGIRNPEELPDLIKDLPYEGMYDDQELDKNLMWRHYTLNQSISPTDIRGFTDPALRKKWMQIVKSGTGLDSGQRIRRDNAVKAEVTARTLESDINQARTPKWTSNYEQAIRAYDATYMKIRENGGSDLDAHREAMKVVNDGLWKEVSPGVYQWDTRAESEFSVGPATEINQVVSAIGKDRTLVNSPKLWVGEEPHLQEAAKYFELSRKGREVQIPEYYRSIAKQVGLHPERLMLNRLQQTGRLKENQVEIFEEKNFSTHNQKLLQQNRPSSTYRVAMNLADNEEVGIMLDAVKSPIADANGGYTAIKDANGEYHNIEDVVGKPLNEITHADVLSLIQDGWTNLGVYNLNPRQYMQILVDGGVPITETFDETGQDEFLLYILKNRIQTAQRYTSLYGTNSLVSIPKSEREEFENIISNSEYWQGVLPQWLKLDNMQRDAAKELIQLVLNTPADTIPR